MPPPARILAVGLENGFHSNHGELPDPIIPRGGSEAFRDGRKEPEARSIAPPAVPVPYERTKYQI